MKKENNRKKIKQNINYEQLKSILKNWQEALSANKDLELSIDGKTLTIPQSALNERGARVKFEGEDNQYELNIKLKWREKNVVMKEKTSA